MDEPQGTDGRIPLRGSGSTPPVEPASGLDASHSDPLRTHTPGPWHVGGRFGDVENFVVYDANGWAIADARNFHGKHGAPAVRANTQLMSAAPDLLAELQEIASMIRAVPEGGKRGATLYFGAGHIAQITAAIAKATGAA